jgi:alpha-beta hydrolase superfamily lysophospholipase
MQVTYQVGVEGQWGVLGPRDGIETTEDWLTMNDGTRLFYRRWRTAGSAALLILHGLGAHGGWFLDMGGELAARGLNVWVVDHRGFGRSEGPRGHVTDYRRYLQDIDAMVDAIRAAQPEAKVCVLGHSMGGIFATHYAAAHPEKLAGVLLMNPWVKDQGKVALGTMLAVLFRGIAKSPRPYQLAGGPDVMTTNPEAVKMLTADPIWVRAESAAFFWQILQMRNKVLGLASQIQLPVLVLQAGQDKSVVANASEEAYRRFGGTDKTWKTYPTYAHDSEFEAERSMLDDDIANWVKAHTGREGK